MKNLIVKQNKFSDIESMDDSYWVECIYVSSYTSGITISGNEFTNIINNLN